MKKLLSLLVAAVMVFAAFSSVVHISAETVSGACGESLTWTFDTDTGVLKIEGTGDMYNYSADADAPWYEYRDLISSIIIEDGVTSVGDYAFMGLSELSEVSIPESVNYIGIMAFAYTHLKSIDLPSGIKRIEVQTFVFTDIETLTIPDGVTTIGAWAFHGSKLKEITIPSSVKTIEDNAFIACELSDVYFSGTKAEWGAIDMGEDHDEIFAYYTVVHCTDGDIVPPELVPPESETEPEPETEPVPAETVPAETAPAEVVPDETVPAETVPAANDGVKRDTGTQSPTTGAERENAVLPVAVFFILAALAGAALTVAIKQLFGRK